MDHTGPQLNQPLRQPRPDGMLDTAARTGETHIIEDRRQHQSPLNLPPDQPNTARLAIPLKDRS